MSATSTSGPPLPLASGARLGPYEIVSPLGAGGMGEVYRAKDTRLERVVAIKVLPDGVTASPQTLERFQREARAASALNHPNICTIYDVGTDPPFIAMELLEGETLQQRLRRGPMEVPVLVDIAFAVADALDAAHAKGIVHRDIKPANIFLTRARPEDSRFRAGEGGLRTSGRRCRRRGHSFGRGAVDGSRQHARDGVVHVARAGPREAVGRAHGFVLVRRRALRNGDGHAAISRGQLRDDFRCDSQPRACASGAPESRCAGGIGTASSTSASKKIGICATSTRLTFARTSSA